MNVTRMHLLILKSFLLAALFLGLRPSPSLAGESLPYAKVTFEISKAGEPGQPPRLTFKVSPLQDLVVNPEGPWQIVIESPDLPLSKNKLVRGDFDDKIPGFTTQAGAVPTKTKGKLSYSLTAFICTKDKTRCYRDVIKGEDEWTLP